MRDRWQRDGKPFKKENRKSKSKPWRDFDASDDAVWNKKSRSKREKIREKIDEIRLMEMAEMKE